MDSNGSHAVDAGEVKKETSELRSIRYPVIRCSVKPKKNERVMKYSVYGFPLFGKPGMRSSSVLPGIYPVPTAVRYGTRGLRMMCDMPFEAAPLIVLMAGPVERVPFSTIV